MTLMDLVASPSAPIDSISNLEVLVRSENGQNTAKPIWNMLLDISREIPENANNLDSHMAEYLAGRFLLGLDKCGELYSMAVHYEMKTEILKKKEFSLATVVRAVDIGVKSAKEREIYAYSDEGYISAAEKYASAKMFRLMVEEKRDAFYKAHYLMRKILERSSNVNDIKVVGVIGGNGEGETADTEWTLRSTWAK